MPHLPHPVTAEHVAFASAHLLEMEAAHAPAAKRNEARRRWKALARRWRLQRMAGAEDRRLDGRSEVSGSIASDYVGAHGAVNKSEQQSNMRKS